ncbi:MAG: MFS transporter [Prevotella sp.]|nr:MFS transporter [Prevotella sp.]
MAWSGEGITRPASFSSSIVDTLWNRNYLKVMTANFSLFFAFYILAPLLPLYLYEQFGASKDIMGVVLSGYTLTALLSRPISGFLVDAFDRKRMLMVFYALFFIFFAGYFAAGSLLLFAIVRTLHGGAFGGLTVANSTVAIDVLPSSRRNEGIGYYGLSNNFAMALAPSAGIAIYQYTGRFELLFWVALVVAGIGLAVDHTVTLPKQTVERKKRPLSIRRFFLLRGWLLAVNMVFFGFCFGVLQNYLAIYSKEVMGVTTGTGVFFILLSSGLVVTRLMGAKSLRKGRLTRIAAVGALLSTFGYGIFVFCNNSVGYFLSPLLIGLGNGSIWPAFMNMTVNVAGDDQRGTANSTLLVSWDVGMGMGLLLGGVMAEHAGYAFAFHAVVVMQLAGTALFLLATRSFFLKRRLR